MDETKMYHTIPKHNKTGNMGTIRGKHCTYMQEWNERCQVPVDLKFYTILANTAQNIQDKLSKFKIWLFKRFKGYREFGPVG